ncbi:2'-5' RNA ligase [Scopulibacillus daqui]|uniref:RNA 2',3'-cyclic phosphodiesterase n=1 Tax=Scopulibacillus daqui TaxID=1469162 RepID=A0ABS2PXW9_9BACL|nr:RNA 2',3'-cyclic phosphodiesterase [Scopulibacillus daqui]MBM7644877.1 2'-5' RNA ligase [Scopulibacillus daqui]
MEKQTSSHYFIAFPLPLNVRKQLYDWANVLKSDLNYRYWTHIEDYHITCVFLGETSENQLKEIKTQLNKFANESKPFELHLNGIGTFGRKDKPRVLYGDIQGDDHLFAFQRAVYQICSKAGFELDKRSYRPHVTIAKKWGSEQGVSIEELISEKISIQEMKWLNTEAVIYKVVLNQTPRYLPVERFALKGHS